MAHGKLRRGSGIALLAAIAAVVPAALLVLGLVLHTEGGTRLAARIGLGWYGDSIPGGVAVASVSGRLGDRFLLRGVRLWDRTGAPLISARELEVEWSPLSLLGGSLRVERVTIRGAEVHLGRELSASGFADLAPLGIEPGEGTAGPGPDLPFALLADLRLEDVALVRPGRDGADETIVHVANLALALAAAGTRAELTVTDGSASAPGLGSADLKLAAVWDEPVAALIGLRATTDLGTLLIRTAAFDVAAQAGFVDAVVAGDAGALGERFGIPLEQDVTIPLFVSGGPRAARASLAVMDGPQVAIEISAAGSFVPVLEVLATMEAWPAGGTAAGPAGGAAFARIHALLDRRAPGGGIERACAVVVIDDLALPAAALSGLLDLPALGGALRAEADCERTAGALVCRGEARGRDLGLDAHSVRRVDLDLSLSPLAPALPFAAHLAAQDLELGGERISQLDARADGTADGMEVALHAVTSRGDRLRTRAAVDLRDGVAVTLHRLGARYRGAAASITRPATVSYRRGALAVRDFELRVAGGTARIDGDIGPDAASDLSARVVGVRLERLPGALVGRGTTGRVRLAARISGGLDSPRGHLTLTVKGLGLGARPLGDLRLVASHDGSRLTVDGDLAGRGDESARLRATAPLHLGPGGPDFQSLGRLPLELLLTLRGVALARLAPLVPGAGLTGGIDAELAVEGTLRAPRVTLSARVRRLSVRDVELGDVELFAAMSNHRLYLDLKNEHGVARSLKLVVEAELAGSPLEARALRLQRGGSNEVGLVAKGLRLDLLGALLPGAGISGVADVEARVNGPPDNPYGRLEVVSQGIAYGRVAARSLLLRAEHSDGSIVAEGRIDGGAVGSIEVFAELPIRLALDAPPRWERERRHELGLGAAGLDLHALRRMAFLGGLGIDELPIGGHVDVAAMASGDPSHPSLEATLASGDASWRSRRFGTARARLEIGRGTARLHAQVVQAEGGFADLVASAPFDLGMLPFEARWDRRGAHAIRLQAVGIDRTVLAPFWEAPAGTELRLDVGLDGAGGIDDFAMRGEWNGALLVGKGATVPFRGRLAADLRDQSIALELGPPGAAVAALTARTEVAIDELLRGEGHPADAPLAARIAIPGLELRVLEGLLPTGLYGIEGRLLGEIVVDGTLGAPRPRGYLELEQGAITIVELGQRLRRIGLRAGMDGRRISFDDLVFSSGEGRGSADGEFVLAEDGSVRASVNARLRKFPFVKPGLPHLTVDSAVAFLAASDRKTTEATVTLRGTRIKLLTRKPSRAPARLPPAGRIAFADLGNGSAAAAPPAPAVDDSKHGVTTRLVIDVSDPIEITGPDVSMRWGGSLSVVSASGRNVVSGGIAAEGGRFWLLNNTFVIDSGEVSLPAEGPLDPYIRLVARTETQAALVTVEIKGRLSRPDLTLTSDPAMGQYQILTLLLTGRSDTGEGGEDSDEVSAQAASLLIALNNPVLEQQLSDRLGVDRIGLSLGEDVDEPILAVGKRLGRHFYVETEYHHNAPSTENRTGGRVEYYINPRWSIETYYGDANKGGIDLFWRKRFGRSKPGHLPLPGESAAADRDSDRPEVPAAPADPAAPARE
jgi:autotransporter translocation and assembly factor TamB